MRGGKNCSAAVRLTGIFFRPTRRDRAIAGTLVSKRLLARGLQSSGRS
jgi:hypothetical protein